jgi:beta-N-acetylhexosaminidase
VADVNNNPANPIINTRSFGEDPAAVSRLVAAYVRGANEHGLSTTAKHFPGHGDTGIDSHIALPLTTGRPATLSRRIMTDVLRDSLGFTGIVVTDALTMGAVVARYGAGESAVLAFEAGSDLLLMPSDLRAAVDAMVTAVESGRISMDRLDRSVRRLVELKVALGLFDRRLVSLDSVPEVVGRRAFQQIADDIAARGLTLVTRGPIDDFRARRGRTAVITYADETNLSIGGELLRGLRAAGDSVSTFRLYPASGPASYDSARAAIAAGPRVIFAAGVRPIAWRGHVALPDSLAALIRSTAPTRPTLLVSFGSPYLLSQLPGFTGGYLLAWNDVLATERAVARALSGPAAITGLLPISLGPGYPRGAGIMIGGTGGQ